MVDIFEQFFALINLNTMSLFVVPVQRWYCKLLAVLLYAVTLFVLYLYVHWVLVCNTDNIVIVLLIFVVL